MVVNNKRIWLSLAHMSGLEMKYIQEAFDTNWVVPLGPNVDAFEKDLQTFLQEDKHLVALSSGSAALHLALLQLGVGPGDEVICQSFTFSASANPIAYLHASPVFVDSESETWNMDPTLLEVAIRDRQAKTGKLPKAIIPVHLYGMPANMDQIMEIAQQYGIPVVEDAAEALGSTFDGQKCGTFGEFGILSFNGNKIITTSGGGALICSTEAEAAKTKFYATQARDQAPHYQHSEIGFNYRLSNICAGIGRGQMTVLQKYVDRRREINQYFRQKLGHIPGISFQTEPDPRYSSNYWLTSILVNPELSGGKTREDLRLFLDAENMETRPLWKPMHLQPVFKDAPFYGNGSSEALFRDGLCLPSGSILTDEDLDRVSEAILRFFES
jgi:dTDP-4-amino-4,6-dideoxygalactose transaminase